MEYIDSKLTDEDRKELLDPEAEVHFGLGTWLRNLIIYPGIIDVDAILSDATPDPDGFPPLRICHPDMVSSDLTDAVREYLIEKNGLRFL